MQQDNSPQFETTPAEFRLRDVVIRLVQPEESRRWDALVDEYHYLGFRRFAGRGLRYVFAWRGRWVGLAGWQSGAFKCKPRDRWVGWPQSIQFQRLHLLANNTRFLILGAPGVFPNLASHALSRMTRRLSADWEAIYGHPLLAAETFVDPARFAGRMYQAAGWLRLGQTKGFARAGGRYTDSHGQPKDLYVWPLRRDAQRRLRDPAPLPDAFAPNPGGAVSSGRLPELRSLYDELMAIPDFRRAQGRKHTIASVLAVYLLARLAGIRGGRAAAQYAQSLSQKELTLLGAWQNRKTERYEPPSKSVIYRVLEQTDPAVLEAILQRHAAPRIQLGLALATDGKRIREASRNETVTLVDQATGLPLASLGFPDGIGEIAAVRAVLEMARLDGKVITLDARHTVRDIARLIVEDYSAQYLMMVKASAERTFATLTGLHWDQQSTGFHEDPEVRAHGLVERDSIRTLIPPPGTVNYPHIRQIVRIQIDRRHIKTGVAVRRSSTA